jgi:hypothetical protein
MMGEMRFRPRFSLRILFVLIVIVSIPMAWTAYQLNWIRQRHAFLAQHALDAEDFDEIYSQMVPDLMDAFNRGGSPIAWRDELWGGTKHGACIASLGTFPRKTPKPTSDLLWLFGEPRYEQVKLLVLSDSVPAKNSSGMWSGVDAWALKNIPTEETDLAERLFPEAEIRYIVFGAE